MVGLVGLVGLVWKKKLNVTPKEKKEKENNNLCTTRPALLVKMKYGSSQDKIVNELFVY